MIKTLRITSIAAGIAAVVLLMLPAVYGVRGDAEIEQFLGSAGVVDEFQKARGQKRTGEQGQASPLVKQAEAFALYLNPPARPQPAAPVQPAAVRDEPRPVAVTAKFEIIGTSVHASRPELSLALIDEPGKGFYWVRQGSKVGHLAIEQVKDGSVVVRDGQSTSELVVRRDTQRVNLIKGATSQNAPVSPVTPAAAGPVSMPARRGRISPATVSNQPRPVAGKVGVPVSQPVGPNSPPAALPDSQPAATGEQPSGDPEIDKLLANFKQMAEQEGDTGKVDSPEGVEARDAAIDKMIEELRAGQVGSEEAKQLNQLGKELQAGQASQAGGTPESEPAPPAESEQSPAAEPNSPEK